LEGREEEEEGDAEDDELEVTSEGDEGDAREQGSILRRSLGLDAGRREGRRRRGGAEIERAHPPSFQLSLALQPYQRSRYLQSWTYASELL